jgi:plastocyanin
MRSQTSVKQAVVALALAAAGLACGGTGSSTSPATPAATPTTPSSTLPNGFYIRISGMAFSPLDLAAPPGATVTVLNADAMQHSVTSEERENAFTPGAVDGVRFDTGPFTGTASFVLPANAPEGLVIPYYCKVHTSTMATPNGTITIRAAAQPGPPPGTTASSGTGGTGGMPSPY